MQICYVIANHGFMPRNMQNSQSYRSQHCEGLKELHVNVDNKIFRTFIRFVFRTDLFLWLPEDVRFGERTDALERDNQSQILLFPSAFIIPQFRDYGEKKF